MSRKIAVVAAALALSVIAGCESQPSKEDIGMATGPALGGDGNPPRGPEE